MRRRPAAPAAAVLGRELETHREELAAQNEELRRLNAELILAKERYARLFDVAPIGYFTLDGAGMVVEANLSGADLLGVRRAVLFGMSFDEMIVPGHRETFRAMRTRVVDTGARGALDTAIASAARRFPARVEAARFGAGSCILCVSDETDRRRTEDERRALESRVADAQRRESLGQLAGGIANDFHDTLAVILTHADLALADLRPGRVRADVEKVRLASERAMGLTRQMLAYSGRAAVRTEVVDLTKVLRAIESLLRATLSNSVALDVELEENLPRMWGDPIQLQQIVLNLVVNAAEALGGRTGRIIVRTTAPNGRERVVLEVTDDGPGMDEQTQRRACDPFFSTKPRARGLGLAVVQGNVRAHDGTLLVTSHPGHGTTFRIELPAMRASD